MTQGTAGSQRPQPLARSVSIDRQSRQAARAHGRSGAPRFAAGAIQAAPSPALWPGGGGGVGTAVGGE